MNRTVLMIAAVAIIAVLLVGSTAISHSVEAKKKTGKVAVTVTNWNCAAHDMKYRVQTLPEEKTIGLKTFNFWKHEIECDQPTFTLDVSFNAKGLQKGKELFVCVHDVDTGVGFCGDNITFKSGEKLHATVDMAEQ